MLACAEAPEEAPPLRVLSLPTAPFLYLDDAGELRGLEYDLLKAFADSQGRALEIVWADAFPPWC